ncbi:MAG: T9SS type A sorting domain-containing protein [Cytophagales bacterium]|nr:T9SS type A sorting domain-containing protein [Cytophagales bacterium]
MSKSIIILVCLCMMFIKNGVAQYYFERTYSTIRGHSVKETLDKGYIVSAGTSDSLGTLGIRLIKINKYGDAIWVRTFGGMYEDYAGAVIQNKDENYLVVGSKGNAPGGFGGDVWLIKTDKNGNLLWDKTYGWGDDAGLSIQQTNDDGYILGGWTTAGGILRLFLIKIDTSGVVQWQKRYGIGTWSTLNSVKQTPDGGYIVGGALAKNTGTLDDVYAMKTDSAGFIQWSKTFDGGMSYWDNGFAIDLTTDGGYIIAGYSNYYDWPPFSNLDGFVIRLDASGNELWRKTFAYSGHDWFRAIHQLPDGGYIIAGSSDKDGTGNTDMWLLRLDENGDSLWSRRFGGGDGDDALDMQITNDNGYILCGSTKSFATVGIREVYLVKTDCWGFTDSSYQPTADFSVDSIIINNVYFTNISDSACTYKWFFGDGDSSIIENTTHTYLDTGTYSVMLIAYTAGRSDTMVRQVQITNVVSIKAVKGIKNWVKVYPNPNDGNMQIDYQLHKWQEGKLIMYDIMGKLLFTYKLVNEKNTLKISESALSYGLYFYKIVIDNNVVSTDKLLIIK